MWLHATKTIGGGYHAAKELGLRAAVRIRRLPIITVLAFAFAALWLIVAGWSAYIRPEPFDLTAYERYQEEVAKCRELKTSESRYDCVAQALIGRDRTNFGKAMFVFLPPLLMILGHYIWLEVRANMREREHARHAEERARMQLSRLRQEMREQRAAAQATRALVSEARQATASARAPSPPAAAPTATPFDGPAPTERAPKRA